MLSILTGKRFNCISRAADMLCLFLGEDHIHINICGERLPVSEYSLHLQPQWRFKENGAILLASQDIYIPFSDEVADDWQYDLVGRPDEESSVFDVCAKELTAKMQGAFVAEAHLSDTNDIRLVFSNGVVFEQFTPSSVKTEEWRLIDYINDVHIVCYDENGEITKE